MIHHQTCHVEWCCRQNNILNAFSRPFHVFCTCMGEEHRAPLAHLPILVVNGKWPVQLYGAGHRARGLQKDVRSLRPPLWGWLLVIWLETFTPVVWRSFCGALAVLVLFLLSQRGRCQSCRGFLDLLGPVQLSWSNYLSHHFIKFYSQQGS